MDGQARAVVSSDNGSGGQVGGAASVASGASATKDPRHGPRVVGTVS